MFGYFRLKRELKEMKERYNLLNDRLDLVAMERELFNRSALEMAVLMQKILASLDALDEREQLLGENLKQVEKLRLKLKEVFHSLNKENSTDYIIN